MGLGSYLLDQRLVSACKSGKIEKVMKLLDKGAHIDYNEGSPLHCALGHEHDDVVMLLLGKGAFVYSEHFKFYNPKYDDILKSYRK